MGVYCKKINNYECLGGFISLLFLSMCIAHPICLCVAMIG